MRSHLERMGETGLLEQMFGWVFIDWAHVDTNGISAAYNAIFAGACDAAVKIAAIKNDDWAAERYRLAAESIRSNFQAFFFNESKGLLTDAVNAGEASERFSEQSNAAAIAFDCVDAACADSIIKNLFVEPVENTIEAQPFFMVVVLAALQKRQRRDLALQLIDERWGKRMVDRGYTSCTEEWYQNGSWRDGYFSGFQRTHSHAWSACAAEFLITGLTGIDILEAGCKTLRIDALETSEPYTVVYPTPAGDVRIAWDGKTLDIQSPDSIHIKT